MGTDFIDRDLMSAAARRGTDPTIPRRPSREERQAEIDSINEREAALLAESFEVAALRLVPAVHLIAHGLHLLG